MLQLPSPHAWAARAAHKQGLALHQPRLHGGERFLEVQCPPVIPGAKQCCGEGGGSIPLGAKSPREPTQGFAETRTQVIWGIKSSQVHRATTGPLPYTIVGPSQDKTGPILVQLHAHPRGAASLHRARRGTAQCLPPKAPAWHRGQRRARRVKEPWGARCRRRAWVRRCSLRGVVRAYATS